MKKEINYIERLTKLLDKPEDLNIILTYEREHSDKCQLMSDNEICRFLLNKTRDGIYYYQNTISWINQKYAIINKYINDLNNILLEYDIDAGVLIQLMRENNSYFNGWDNEKMILYLFRKNRNNEFNYETQLRIYSNLIGVEE